MLHPGKIQARIKTSPMKRSPSVFGMYLPLPNAARLVLI
jgi:hypothetical protein